MHRITDATFTREVEESTQPTLVLFWASWCGHSKALSPVLEELEAEFADRLRFVEIDIDENPETAKRFQIRGIPTIEIFKEGSVVERIVGAVPRLHVMESLIKHMLLEGHPKSADEILVPPPDQTTKGRGVFKKLAYSLKHFFFLPRYLFASKDKGGGVSFWWQELKAEWKQ